MIRFRSIFSRIVVLLSLALFGYFVSITNLYIYSTFAIALAPKESANYADKQTEPPPISNPLIALDFVSKQSLIQHGDHWISYYKVRASLAFTGNESITLTTPADHTLLENLVLLAERWRGPISCAVYAPGTDYALALKAIRYLRECTSPLVKDLVSFHLFFHRKHIPEDIEYNTWKILHSDSINCSKKHNFGRRSSSYRKLHKMVFPINVARNIAREAAQTYFVFPCDVELVPSPGVIPNFFEMISNANITKLYSPNPKVFVLPVFEIKKTVTFFPKNKVQLKELFDRNESVSFHRFKCPVCHKIPNLEEWLVETNVTRERIFRVAKRYGRRAIWEPFYIGTNMDPVFDERVTWEGKSNKRIQAYVLCVLDYEFHILSKAFLVHRPGIRYLYRRDLKPTQQVLEMDWRIHNIIKPEYDQLYGARNGCLV